MQINFVYIGEKRFEEEGLKNHQRFYNMLDNYGIRYNIIDKCKPSYANDEFSTPATNQIWDFYNAIDEFDADDIVVKMRTDNWISMSSYPYLLTELQSLKGCVFIGSELKQNYNVEWSRHDLLLDQDTRVTGDFIVIAKKSYMKPKDEMRRILEKNAKVISGNVLWQKIRNVDSKFCWGQIHLIRSGVEEYTDEYVAYNFANSYVQRDGGDKSHKTYNAMMYYKNQLASGLSNAS